MDILFILIIPILLLCGCDSEKLNEDLNYSKYTDKDTCVIYLSRYHGGITPMLNEDGTLKIVFSANDVYRPIGKYYLKEIDGPEYLIQSKDKYEFEILQNVEEYKFDVICDNRIVDKRNWLSLTFIVLMP